MCDLCIADQCAVAQCNMHRMLFRCAFKGVAKQLGRPANTELELKRRFLVEVGIGF